MYFSHAVIYLSKLQIDDVILHEWDQACPSMPSSYYKFMHAASCLLKL